MSVTRKAILTFAAVMPLVGFSHTPLTNADFVASSFIPDEQYFDLGSPWLTGCPDPSCGPGSLLRLTWWEDLGSRPITYDPLETIVFTNRNSLGNPDVLGSGVVLIRPLDSHLLRTFNRTL